MLKKIIRFLSDLTGDVLITSPAQNDHLVYNGFFWVNVAVNEYTELGPGAAGADGNWKIEVSGTSLIFYRREASTWVQKFELTA